ncbi:MAG TPA: glyoxalase/bleomycin resistance/extradiol dioxygenase family protein [Polyangiaceae bacterium]|nr:glyoxalase/bleomycin resistance/extradiol dioxygenase family protein [Polyangiaceae bacterium]
MQVEGAGSMLMRVRTRANQRSAANKQRSNQMTMKLSNYLFFQDGCEAALAFYSECGFGTVALLVRHGSGPMEGKVMHARFSGPGVNFFASDNDDAEPMRGSAMMFEFTDRAETAQLFGRLAQKGRITTPLGVQPWGDYYGKLTDRFGVQWMFNCTEAASI